MTNESIMTLNLKRLNMLDLQLAVLGVIHGFQHDINNPELSEERKQIAQSAIDRRWQPLLDELERQFKEQDE